MEWPTNDPVSYRKSGISYLLIMNMLTLAITTTILSCAIYSFAYLYFLGLRMIRTNLDDKTGAFLLAFIVATSILTATVCLEAVVLIAFTREVSGRLFYVGSALGIVVVAMSAAGIVGIPKPINTALAHRKAVIWGLAVGNPALLCINILSFTVSIPSVL